MSGAHWSCMGESDNHQLPVAPTTGNTDLQMQIWQSPDRWIKRASPGTGPNTSCVLLYSLFNHICFESFSSFNLSNCKILLYWHDLCIPDCFLLVNHHFSIQQEYLYRHVDMLWQLCIMLKGSFVSLFVSFLFYEMILWPPWWPQVRTPTYLKLCTFTLISTTSQSSYSSGNVWFAATASFFCGEKRLCCGCVGGCTQQKTGNRKIFFNIIQVSTLIICELQYLVVILGIQGDLKKKKEKKASRDQRKA